MQPNPADAAFTALARDYLDDRAQRHPGLATDLGDHRFDDQLPEYSAAALESERRAQDGWAARLAAIDTELAARQPGRPAAGTTILLCSCGFGTDDRAWLDGHLFQYPGHHERPQP